MNFIDNIGSKRSSLIAKNIFNSFVKAELNDELENDTMEKGLSYEIMENKAFEINKTGKEIKEKLSALKTNVQQQMEIIQNKMNDCISLIGVEPDYSRNDNGEVIISTYRKYFFNDIQFQNENGVIFTSEQTNKVKEMMGQYNDLAYQYCENQNTLNDINLLLNNLPDNKTFSLSISALKKLGF